jgi:TRAP-type C4-dicarboxylate transport system permease small subunit
MGAWLSRRAENVLAAMLAVIFVAFLLQIAFRYLLGLPIGWTHEVSVILWVWLVLWGAAFVVSEREEIRFDIIYGSVGPRARRIMAIVTAFALVALYPSPFPRSSTTCPS